MTEEQLKQFMKRGLDAQRAVDEIIAKAAQTREVQALPKPTPMKDAAYLRFIRKQPCHTLTYDCSARADPAGFRSQHRFRTGLGKIGATDEVTSNASRSAQSYLFAGRLQPRRNQRLVTEVHAPARRRSQFGSR